MARKAISTTSKTRLPTLGRHSSGAARVILNGKAYYCGPHGTIEAQTAYTDLLARWEANGRRPLDPVPVAAQMVRVRDLIAKYSEFLDATGRYRKLGEETSQRGLCRGALDGFVAICGDVHATKLSDVMVRKFRDELETGTKIGRPFINKKIAHVKAALRWARERGMLTRDQWLGVAELQPLSRRECAGRENKHAKRAVTPAEVEAVAAKASRGVAMLLRIQAATGMRPGEACKMRWCDLSAQTVDIDGIACTIYTVPNPKNENHGGAPTTYALPPRIVAMIGTATSPSDHVVRTAFDKGYEPHGYGNAVAAACVLAQVAHFTPHEVRHGFLTRAANRYGVMAASAAANHAGTAITEGYLHKDRTAGYRVVVGLDAATTG